MNNESDDFIDDLKYALGVWIREDYKTAYKVLLPLAEQWNVIAQYNLRVMYDSGDGIPLNYEEKNSYLKNKNND